MKPFRSRGLVHLTCCMIVSYAILEMAAGNARYSASRLPVGNTSSIGR